VWVTPNGADGRLVRVDVRSGQVSARISAHPVYFGSVLAFGAGFVWTGNDDERYRRGTTVSKLDPGTNHLVGRPLALGSPQSIAFGAGAVWVADHAGWLVKIDPRTLEVVARQRLDFGPHGVVATRDGVYVADAHGSRLLEADPRTAAVRRVARLPIGPIYPAVGAGSIWSSPAAVWQDETAQDDRVVRIDPKTLTVAETFHLAGNASAVAFGFGSVWATVATGQVVRITPE
jgi:DNA-binding beta-propeller fold protein YncE